LQLDRVDEAIIQFSKAIQLHDDSATAHLRLGVALRRKGRLDEAIVQYRKTITLSKGDAVAHNNLGNALRDKGLLAEAVGEYREAVRLKNDYPEARDGLGAALVLSGRVDEAIPELQKAIALKADYAEAHNDLGIALYEKHRLKESIAKFKLAIGLKRPFPEAHVGLANALHDQGRIEEAIREYRKAIHQKPDFAMAYCNLGVTLLHTGDFEGAVRAIRRGHELGTRSKSRWTHPSARLLGEAQTLAQLDRCLPAFLKGEAKPADGAESLRLAVFCQERKEWYADAARFYTVAFGMQPALAEDLDAQHRYNAACAAALAAAGHGKDAGALDKGRRTRLRQRALEWLRADLALYVRLGKVPMTSARAVVQQRLSEWQRDADLASVRCDALGKLPEAERDGWRKLWSDIDQSLARSRATDQKGAKADTKDGAAKAHQTGP
jgi:Flp pilus assembly protein TadD